MNIAEVREKCKGILVQIPKDVIIISILLCASSASFVFGYLAGREGGQGIEYSPSATLSATPTSTGVGAPTETSGFVASKNGTKYYLPDCAGAERISPSNIIWFATAAAAVSAGYTPAANCKGL